jgi:flagellar biosynthesis chaperone FliJ
MVNSPVKKGSLMPRIVTAWKTARLLKKLDRRREFLENQWQEAYVESEEVGRKMRLTMSDPCFNEQWHNLEQYFRVLNKRMKETEALISEVSADIENLENNQPKVGFLKMWSLIIG